MSTLDLPSRRRPITDPSQRRTQLSCRLEALPSRAGSVTVLSVAGEIDSSTCPAAETALDVALDHAPGAVVVDLAELTFCSIHGLQLLGAPTGTVSGHAYVLAGMAPRLQRAADLLWASDQPARYLHAAAAVTALRAAPA